MSKLFLVSATALAMMSSVALAQTASSDTSVSTQSTTQTPAPMVGTFSASKSQKVIDSNGVETDKSQSYSSGANGSRTSTTSRVTAPDGTPISTSHDEAVAAPNGATTTTSRTTTVTGH